MTAQEDGLLDLPDFPLFEVSDAEIAFGAKAERYVGDTRDDGKQIGSKLARRLRKEADAGSKLFHCGGRLTDYGFRVRDGIDSGKVFRALSALLASWAPSHEQKMGTVALAIHHWCEPTGGEA